jgi:outer membrane lipoprotein-sorting protein
MGSRELSSLMGGLVLSFLLAGLVQAAEFSAVTVTKTGGLEMQGKIFVKGDKARMEAATPMGNAVSIVRTDKKVMWMLLPGQKSYMEMPVGQEALAKALNVPEDGVAKKLLGSETLNGYEAEKYETTIKLNGREMKSIMWISKKSGIPLRVEGADKSFSIDYKDIKEGGVDDALFEMPAGYKKMNMPGGMPGMPKM